MTNRGYSALSTTTYDAYGRPTIKTYGNDTFFASSNAVETTYDTLDNITQIKYNNDNTKRICYFYGSDNRLSRTIDYFEGTTTLYFYDFADRVIRMQVYDDVVINAAVQVKNDLKYTYADKTNYLVGVKQYTPLLGTQEITYRYGNLANGEMPDQIYGVSVNGVEKQTFTYDGLGRATNRQTKTTANVALNNTYTYEDIAGTAKTTTNVKTITNAIGTYTYSYDKNGNITKEQFNPVDSVKRRIPAYEKTYEYDSLNQLTRVNDGQWEITIAYAYDTRGNMLSQKLYEYTTGTLSSDAETISYSYGDTFALATNDCLTRFDGKQNAYDAIGNPEGYKGWSLQWNERRLLSQAIIPKGSVSGANWTVNFAYNANGQRTQKTFTEYGTTVTTTKYLYNGDKLAGQQFSNGKKLTFLYDHNGEYIGLDYNGTEYYYIKNLQGDVIAIADATGTIVGTYTYSAWGEVYYMTGLSSSQIYEFTDNIVAINPIRYRGYYYDAETGLYYLNSRYYDPSTGRFVNADGFVSTGQAFLGIICLPTVIMIQLIESIQTGCFGKKLETSSLVLADGFLILLEQEVQLLPQLLKQKWSISLIHYLSQ